MGGRRIAIDEEQRDEHEGERASVTHGEGAHMNYRRRFRAARDPPNVYL